MKKLMCYICEKEISEDAKTAKIISIKRIQRDETNARTIEYEGCQEEIYIHLNCLISKNTTLSSCLANNENFNQGDSRIINIADTNLKPLKEENADSFIRSNILNF